MILDNRERRPSGRVDDRTRGGHGSRPVAAVSVDVTRSAITVSLPSVMQSATAGRREVELSSGTVGQVLDGLIETFPDILPRLFTDQRQIHRFVNVYLENEDVRFLQGLGTPVLPGQRLTILSAIAGG